MKKYILLAALLTFSAKPMAQQTFSILEKTGAYLSEMAPEIAAFGGSLIIADQMDRPDVFTPMPMTEPVKYTSDDLDIAIELTDKIKDSLTTNVSSDGGCNPF